MAKPSILQSECEDEKALYSLYMPFVKNGGLFIETDIKYNLGDEIFVLFTIKSKKEKLPLSGKVIWITPPGAPAPRKQGIGIQFSKLDMGKTQKKIEDILGTQLNSGKRTLTL